MATNSSADQDDLTLARQIKLMNDIRITHVEVRPESKGKIIAMFVIGLAVAAAGFYTYSEGWWKAQPKPAVSADQLPQLTPPIRPEAPKPI